ncbi:MAG TPA: arylesterase [Gemmatimonadaceae bacterium]|nr:arylesterase [Gemmatimonadaceae bacterium]
MRSVRGWIPAAAMLLAAGCGGAGDSASSGDRAGPGSATDTTMAGAARGSDAGSASARDSVSRARGPRVLFVGTSLTAGLGLATEDAYPALLARRADSLGLDFEFVNAGLSGETSAGALRRIDWLLQQGKPAEVVVIETGANDGLRGLDVDSTRANLRRVVRKVKAALPSVRVLLAQMEAPPNLGPKYTEAFHAMYGDVAREEGVTLMPFLLEGVAGVDSLNQGDGIHPNEAGERIVADNVWRLLEPMLRELDPVAKLR